MTDAELIEQLGGCTAVAVRLGLDLPNGARRVNNWKRRGIPARVKLENRWLQPSRVSGHGRVVVEQASA